MLPGASTGHHRNRQSSEAPTSPAQTESPRDSTSPLPSRRAPDRFPNFQFGNLMPLYVPGYYNQNKTMGAQHFNFSLQRQLDKSTVLTVAYVGTLAHHVEHGVNIIYGDSGALPVACRLRAGRRRWRLSAKRPKRLRHPCRARSTTRPSAPTIKTPAGGPVVAFAEANYDQNSGNSNYNSLQVSAERRSRDITYLLSLYLRQVAGYLLCHL